MQHVRQGQRMQNTEKYNSLITCTKHFHNEFNSGIKIESENLNGKPGLKMVIGPLYMYFSFTEAILQHS